MTAGFSSRKLLVALAVVALGLPAAFAGLFNVISHIGSLNADIATVREAQLDSADVLRLQIEQETAVRGYIATHDPSFRETVRSAEGELPRRAADLSERVNAIGDPRASTALRDARTVSRRWFRAFAEPVFGGTAVRAGNRVGEGELARFRVDIHAVDAALAADYRSLIEDRRAAVRLASYIGYSALAVIGLQIIVYAIVAERLRGELMRERSVVTSLQRAFTSEIVADRHVEVGAAYVSATRGAKVGGDVYDVFPLDDQSTLIAIADVSGKGVGAAVDSTFVKYSLRAFASESRDIAAAMRTFNTLYARSQRSSEAFVVVFAGILDRGASRLTYVNAGHEAAYVCRPGAVEQLAPTGPIVGIADDTDYRAATTAVGADDILFLSTDGLTEARDPGGAFLGSTGVERWLNDRGDGSPQQLVDALTRRLRQFTRARSNDDLAILAIRPKRPPEVS